MTNLEYFERLTEQGKSYERISINEIPKLTCSVMKVIEDKLYIDTKEGIFEIDFDTREINFVKFFVGR